MTDGEFPRASAKDIFFSDPVREKIGLVAAEELLDQDRFIFYCLLDSSANKVMLTYPRFEGDRALVPSTFLADLEAIAGININIPEETNEQLNPRRLLKKIGFNIQLSQNSESKNNIEQILNTGLVENKDLIWTFDRIERSFLRIFKNQFSSVEGILDTIEPVQTILSNRYLNRSWSVTMLEEYAFCPMQFFLDHVLKIEELPDMEDDISSLERGIAVHQILFRFFNELKKLNKSHRPAEHPALLRQIAEEIFKQMPFSGIFWDLEQQVYFGSDQSKGLLDTFLEYDQEQINVTGFRPVLFELAFGYTADSEKDESSAEKAVVLQTNEGTLKINGKIDRVDLDERNNALIFDYKTGIQSASGNISEIIEGTRFQLPLYMLVLMKMYRSINAGYAGYYLVKDADHCKRKDVLADKEIYPFVSNRSNAGLPNNKFTNADGNPIILDNLLRTSLDHAIRKVKDIRNGVFRHTKYPENAGCESYCAFRRICQKNTGKINRINVTGEE